MTEQKRDRTPLGIVILGSLNCFFGLMSLISYSRITPENFEKLLELLKNKNFPAGITFQQFRMYSLFPVVGALIFLAGGLGLLMRKEWARRLTIYFSFTMVIFIALAVVTQPFLIGVFIPQILYLGALIMYFTGKRTENYFVPSKKEEPEEGRS